MCLLFTLRSGFTASRNTSQSPSTSSILSRLLAFPKLIAPYLLWSLLPFLVWIFIFLKVPLPSAIVNPSVKPQDGHPLDLDVVGEGGGLAHIPDSATEIIKPVPVDSQSVEGGFGFLLSGALTREAVVGVTLIALLSGSGAMSAAFDTWESFFSKKK